MGWGDEYDDKGREFDFEDRAGDPWDTVKPDDLRGEETAHASTLDYDDFDDMLMDGEVETADGCIVEPDGRCPHGYRSPLLVRGLI